MCYSGDEWFFKQDHLTPVIHHCCFHDLVLGSYNEAGKQRRKTGLKRGLLNINISENNFFTFNSKKITQKPSVSLTPITSYKKMVERNWYFSLICIQHYRLYSSDNTLKCLLFTQHSGQCCIMI